MAPVFVFVGFIGVALLIWPSTLTTPTTTWRWAYILAGLVSVLASPVLVLLCMIVDYRGAKFAEDWHQSLLFQDCLRTQDSFVLVLRSFGSSSYTETVDDRSLPSGGDGVMIPDAVRFGKVYTGTDLFADIYAQIRHHRLVMIGGTVDEISKRAPNMLIVRCPDHCWFDVFERLASASKAVLLLPESSHGLTQEIREVVSSFVNKTVVVMPDSRSFAAGDRSVRSWERQNAWEASRQELRQRLGLSLPAYDPHGMIWVPNSDLSVKRVAAFSVDALNELVAQTSAEGQSLGTTLSTVAGLGLLSPEA